MTGGRAVILGSVGRNFAAGMSGGLAYVLNEDNNFDYFCNMEMVELSLIEDSSDERELKGLITSHYNYTQSPKAKEILDNWGAYISKFLKVLPIEYKRVLDEEKLEALKRKVEKVEHDY
jgi:glutamate synthase (NADPH/NADH) large chain